MNKVTQSLKAEINKDHELLTGRLKSSVEIAIKIGGNLIAVKEQVGHGNFIDWIKENCNFHYANATNYIKLYEYKSKLSNSLNLTEAHKVIETIEEQEKRKKEIENENKYKEFKRTGVKPENWTKADDYAYKKFHDDKTRTQRIKESINKKIEEAEKKKTSYETEKPAELNTDKLIEELTFHFNKFENLKSGVAGNEDIVAIIEIRLEKAPDDNRRLEICNTLIKFLREKAIHYNKKNAKTS